MLNEAQNSLTILSMRRKQINVSHHAMVNLWKFRLCGCTAKNQTVTDDVVDISRCFKEYNEIVDEARTLSGFFPTHADLITEMHF